MMTFGGMVRSALAGAAFLAATGPGMAQEAAPPEAPQLEVQFSGWRTSCSGANRTALLNCAMIQQAVTANGQPFVSVEVRVPGETRAPVMLIRIPLGFAIEPGLRYFVDTNEPADLPIQACETAGCYAGTAVTDALLNAMRRGATFFLSFEQTDGVRGTIEIPLGGFAAAYDGIR
ncbi:MAG: invasion associated locus B family protein [Bauldia sp.]